MEKMSVNGRRPMSESELKQYMQSLRKKTQKYKECKTTLQFDRNELGVLQRTNEILRGRDPNLNQYLEQKEQEKEMKQKRNALQKVSAMKNELDQQKERKLDNVADVVAQINHTLKMKKNRLQPLVKRLKEKRIGFKQSKEEYLEKQKIYKNMRIGYDSELSKLEQMVNSLKKVVANLETRYHRMDTQIKLDQVRLEKVRSEERYQNGGDVLDKQFKCYRDLYDNEISRLLHVSKSTRTKQEHIREGHSQNVQQKEYFAHLQQLMRCKLDIVQSRVEQMASLNEHNQEDEDRLVFID